MPSTNLKKSLYFFIFLVDYVTHRYKTKNPKKAGVVYVWFPLLLGRWSSSKIYLSRIDLIGVLVNAMHSGRSGYSWDLNRIDIPIAQFSLKIHSNPLWSPIDLTTLYLPKLR